MVSNALKFPFSLVTMPNSELLFIIQFSSLKPKTLYCVPGMMMMPSHSIETSSRPMLHSPFDAIQVVKFME